MLNNNYKEVLKVARRICQPHAKELINETYISIHHLQHPEQNIDFVKWFSKSMANNKKWSNSSFNKAIKINATDLTHDVPEVIHTQLDPTESLQMHEKELFLLHYEHDLSARQIAELIGKENNTVESYQSYQRLINIMKTKINKWKQSTL